MTRRAALVLSLTCLGSWAVAPASAGANPHKPPPKPRTVSWRASFSRVGAEALAGGGGNVLLMPSSTMSSSGTLILSNGRRRVVSFPGCEPPQVFGGPWLTLDCGSGTPDARFELYRIATGATQTVRSIDPSFGPPGCGVECFIPSGVGADWIAVRFGSCDDHCFPVSEFQNLQTGAGLQDPSNVTTTVNLDSPALSEKVCRPVKVPFAANFANPASWGSVTFDRRIAIVSGPGGVYLERCGSKLHEFLTYTTGFTECPEAGCPPPWNSHLIVWESAPGRLSGIFLPSLQRFTIHVPARVDPAAASVHVVQSDQYTLVLGSRALYLQAPGGVWMTPVPKPRRR
jgi:hypothetical protein